MSAQESEANDSGWGVLADLPGDPMMWVLIFSELAVFGLLLGAFAVAHAFNQPMFGAGRGLLNPALAALNTLVLVTSGWADALMSGNAGLTGGAPVRANDDLYRISIARDIGQPKPCEIVCICGLDAALHPPVPRIALGDPGAPQVGPSEGKHRPMKSAISDVVRCYSCGAVWPCEAAPSEPTE